MAITVMNGAQEIEALINPPDTPDLKRDAEGRFIRPDAAESKPASKEVAKGAEAELDETPEWVARGKFSKEQHDIVTDVIKRSIGKKHAQARDAEAFAEEQYNEKMLAERRAEQLERELLSRKPAAEPAKPVEEAKRPERSTFKSDEEYIEAVADWKTEQKFREREVKALEDREKARVQAIRDAATARIVAAREAVPDYDEVVGGVDIEVPGHIAAYMQESELFAELGYRFAQHPEELKRLSDMPSRTVTDLQRIGVALAKIEGTLQPFGQRSSPPPKASNGTTPSDEDDGTPPSPTGSIPRPKPRAAAPVIQPLNVSSATQVDKPESKMSYDEARASWEKRNRRDFSRRSRH